MLPPQTVAMAPPFRSLLKFQSKFGALFEPWHLAGLRTETSLPVLPGFHSGKFQVFSFSGVLHHVTGLIAVRYFERTRDPWCR